MAKSDRHKNQQVALRLEPELLERLKYVSYLSGQSLGDVIKHCLKKALPDLEAKLENGSSGVTAA